ncbi:MAG: hypothetical protein EP335_12055 [Alphaproteobacteria bacterium]|nr:MAG: hypothetical protein EP335_12055 [Alphaproteobacteria bacterium]
MDTTILISIVPALALSGAGLVCAYRGWQLRGGKNGGWLLAMVALWALSTWFWCRGFGVEIGIPLALETASLVAFAGILLRAERRAPKESRDRVAEPPAPHPWRRTLGFVRFLIAGPVAFVAAMAVAVVVATQAPINEQTRLVLAGLMIPTLWAILIVAALVVRRLYVTGGLYILFTFLAAGLTVMTKA